MVASGCGKIVALALSGALMAAGSGWCAQTTGGSDSQSSHSSKSASSESSKKPKSQTQPPQSRPAQKTPTKPKAVPPKAKKQGPALSFTDEDLAKYHSGQTVQPVRSTPLPPGPDPLKTVKEEQEREAWRQKRASELQQKVTDLETRLKTLEKRKLSIRNPLLPRVADPDQNPEAEIGMSGPELLARTDEEIKVTNQQLEAARKDLATFLDKKP